MTTECLKKKAGRDIDELSIGVWYFHQNLFIICTSSSNFTFTQKLVKLVCSANKFLFQKKQFGINFVISFSNKIREGVVITKSTENREKKFVKISLKSSERLYIINGRYQ